MAKGGSRAHREKRARQAGSRSDDYWIKRQNELVATLWKQDRMIGVRNVILARPEIQALLTPTDKEALAT